MIGLEDGMLLYVAMQRAKTHLHFYDVKSYYKKELEPSLFLQELCTEDTQGEEDGIA